MKNMLSKTKRILAAALIALFIWLIPASALAESWSAVIMSKKVRFYSDSSLSDYVGSLSRGEVVRVNSVSGKVAKVSYKGVDGFYCKLSDLTDVMDIGVPAYVNASGVKVYEKMDTKSDSITIAKGYEVIVLAVDDTWALIEANGYGLYMYKGYLTQIVEATPEPTLAPPEVEGVIHSTVSTVKVYKKANTNSEVLSTLSSGDDVLVIVYNKEWAYIYVDGIYGYCHTTSLVKADATQSPTPEPTPAPTAAPDMSNAFPAVVNVSSMKVYAKANTSSTLLNTLKKGAEVNVISYDSTWAYIEKGGYTGYCKTSALKRVEELTLAEEYRTKYPKVQFTATVIYDDAPAYLTEDTTKPDSTFDIGAAVDVYGYSKNWAYVGVGESRCFIAVKHLSSAEYTVLSSGTNGSNTKKLQEELLKLGYFDGEATGNYSTLTETAVRRFRQQLGLGDGSDADVATLRVLYGGYAPECTDITATLSSGSKGDGVTRIQTRLYYLDYLSKLSSIDGDFGSNTTKAVKLFQSEAELDVTGVVDSVTLRALYSLAAPKLPAGSTAADYVASSSGSANSSVLKIPNGLESTQSALPSNPSRAEKIEYVIYLAQLQLGKPYIYATAGPDSFDCSGLTVYCYKQVGVTLGRSAYAHGYNESSGKKISSISDLKRGDIVCFDTISDSDLSDHVGIYLGDGYFIHASSGSSNGRQVCVSSLSSGYYNRVFSWARRPVE